MPKIIDIPYADKTIQAEFPDRTFIIPEGGRKNLEPIYDLKAALKEALSNPLGMPPIARLVKPDSWVTIAFDDLTLSAFGEIRKVAILEVLDQLEKAGVSQDKVTLICANALHRKFRPEELAVVLGENMVKAFGPRLFCHDAEDRENLVYLGKTTEGYDVEVSRYVVESDLTVYIN